MKFNSQICTSREQSERLFALGLKKETADMYIFDAEVYIGKPNIDDIPTWSLHRLIELSNMGIMDSSTDNIYDKVIHYIEFLIKCGDFNKDYLEE